MGPDRYDNVVPRCVAHSSSSVHHLVTTGGPRAMDIDVATREAQHAADLFGRSVGRGPADWALRAIACRLLVRPRPASLDELLRQAVEGKPFYVNGEELVRRMFEGSYLIPELERIAYNPVLARQLVSREVKLAWRTLDSLEEDPALRLYGKNAAKYCDFVEGIQLIQKARRSCVPEGEEMPPDGCTEVVFGNLVFHS